MGPNHPDVAKSLSNLAQLYRNLGDYAQAEPLYKRSLATLEKALGPDHPDVAISLNNLAQLYRNLGDYAQAEPLYKRSLAIWEKALGPDHSYVALSLDNLAYLSLVEGRINKAMRIFQKINNPSGKAVCYLAKGHYRQAAEKYSKSLEQTKD